jgi:hypothetical protein
VDTVPGLKALQARKRELLLESELNRQVWRVEAGQLRLKVERLQRGYDWAQHAWGWAGPVAGFLLARKFKKTAGAFSGGSILLNALKSAWKFWASRRKPSTEDAASR